MRQPLIIVSYQKSINAVRWSFDDRVTTWWPQGVWLKLIRCIASHLIIKLLQRIFMCISDCACFALLGKLSNFSPISHFVSIFNIFRFPDSISIWRPICLSDKWCKTEKVQLHKFVVNLNSLSHIWLKLREECTGCTQCNANTKWHAFYKRHYFVCLADLQRRRKIRCSASWRYNATIPEDGLKMSWRCWAKTKGNRCRPLQLIS